MGAHILQAVFVVTPIIFVLCFGIFAGKIKAFGTEGNPIHTINELVLTFALPPSLFVGTITVSRSALSADFFLFVILFFTLIIAYFIGFFIAKLLFKRTTVEAAIAGLAVSFAAGPFYGPALLGGLYGAQSDVAVSIFALVVNVCIVPLATIIIKLNIAKGQSKNASVASLIAHSIFDAIFKTPFVWAPLLAFILVFLGLHTPDVVNNSLDLIGKATAGIAVFVAGMTITQNKFKINTEILTIALLKNIGLPLLFLAIATVFKMERGTTIFNEGLLLAALPSGPMIALLATRYKAYQQEASSILAVSTIAMLVTVTAIITMLGI